jgi:sulfite reductase beta subunit-like hemoprotein
MSTPSAPVPSGRARASFADTREIDAFVETLGRFERGELDADAWRAYRVVRGAYGQRQDGVHMLRIKLPQGIADAAALRALAEVGARYSRGFGHVTTRQNVQFHFVRPADLEPALRRLAEAGVTTAGAGGNTVRSVVTCPLSGVSPTELFDVTPYAEAVTRHFLRHPLASALPRKFKIAFEGCAEDHVGTPIQDLGFRARVRAEGGVVRRGFTVTVAGGTSSLCTSGAPLHAFLPAGDVLALAEALVRLFHARGDRKNKHRNRLKFLVKDLGFDAFRALLDEELARVRAEGAPRLPFDAELAPVDAAPSHARPAAPAPAEIAARVAAAPPRGPGQPPPVAAGVGPGPGARDAFRRTNVRPQRQPGFVYVTLALPQGDITSAQLEVLAELALAYGDGTARFASTGQVLLRWVPEADVDALHLRLAAAGLARCGPRSAADVVSCPGSEACRMAVTHSRGVARLVEERVGADVGARALDAALPVHVSGCPNGCSQHHLAAIGLQGSARKLGGRAVPQYFVLLGGEVTEAGARFGKLAAKIPARRVPEAVARLAALYLEERQGGETAGAFFARAFERAKAAVSGLAELPEQAAVPDDFVEPGLSAEFRPETTEGECAA